MKNHEGYSDPTATIAIRNVMRETRRKKKMDLKDTIEMMQSDDFKERFRAEYFQTKIRYEKLHKMLVKYEAGTLNFEHKCSIDLLAKQASFMGNYLKTLEIRAEIEGIDLINV